MNPTLGLAARAGSPESPAPIRAGENDPKLVSKVKTSRAGGLPRIYDARSGPSSLALPESDTETRASQAFPGATLSPALRELSREAVGQRLKATALRPLAGGAGFLLLVPLPPTCCGSQQPPSPRRVRRPRAVPESFLPGLRISGTGARPRAATPLPCGNPSLTDIPIFFVVLLQLHF